MLVVFAFRAGVVGKSAHWRAQHHAGDHVAAPSEPQLLGRLLRARAGARGDPTVDFALRASKPCSWLYSQYRGETMRRLAPGQLTDRIWRWTGLACRRRRRRVRFAGWPGCNVANVVLARLPVVFNAVPTQRRMDDGRQQCLLGCGKGPDETLPYLRCSVLRRAAEVEMRIGRLS